LKIIWTSLHRNRGIVAATDPEGADVLAEVQEAVGTDPELHILLLPPTANLEINALQRAAMIIYQNLLGRDSG
jgi:trehalose synthase